MANNNEGGGQSWMGAAATGIAGGLQSLFGSMGLKRRYKYGKKMALYEQELQKDLNQYNAGLAMKQWEDTNAPAQVAQLRKAGLSTGLMYGQTGVGGTANTSTGAGGSGAKMQLPGEEGFRFMGIESALQIAAQQANIALTKAQEKNLEADTTKKLGADTEKTNIEIQSIAQLTQNAALQNDILNLDKQIKEIEMNIAKETQMSLVTKINAEMWKTIGEAESAEAKGEIDQATKEEMITQIEQATVEQQIRISAMKANIQLTQAEIKETYNAIENLKQNTEINWGKLSVDEKEMKIKEELMKFQTSDAARLQQWTNAIKPVVDQALEKRAPLKPQQPIRGLRGTRRVEKGQRGRWSLGE